MSDMSDYYDKFNSDELLKYRALGPEGLSVDAHQAIEEILLSRGVSVPPIPEKDIDRKTLTKNQPKSWWRWNTFIFIIIAGGIGRQLLRDHNQLGMQIYGALGIAVLIGCVVYLIARKNKKVPVENLSSLIGKNGFTEFMYCAAVGDVERLKSLADYGVDIDLQDDSGATALMYAIDKNQIEAVRYLLELKPDLLLKTSMGRTAKDLAGLSNNSRIIALLS